MLFITFLITIIFIIVLILLYVAYKYPNMTYVKADDNLFYLVRDTIDKDKAANILASIYKKIIFLSESLHKNIDKYPDYEDYIKLLHKKVYDIVLIESEENSKYTSYSVNKGEQIIFCLRTKYSTNELHDFNLIMYVVLHEISHVACPIYDNHGPLFRKIFKFLTSEAIKLNLYKKIDFYSEPANYCGMTISDSIV
jgi:hypothetical protein